MTVRAVLLDLDDTLFDHQHCAREALQRVRAQHAGLAGVDIATLEASHGRILEDLHLDVLAGKLDLDAARVERFRRLYRAAELHADDELAAKTAAAYRAGYVEARRAVDDAIPLLQALRARARVVVVSNNLLHEQQEKLRHCGLDRYVDALVVSEEVGASKPDSRIFEVALERAGTSREDAVMVGDSWKNDVEGARAAGIRAVWFNRDGDEAPDPSVPVLRSLAPSPETLRVILEDAAE